MMKRRRDFGLDGLFDGFDELFKDFQTPLSSWATVTAFGPSTSYLSEATETGARVTVDLPGVKAEDASVYVQGKALYVEGKRGEKQYKASFDITGFDASTTKATLEDGVMTVTIDREKKEKSPDRTDVKIEVKK